MADAQPTPEENIVPFDPTKYYRHALHEMHVHSRFLFLAHTHHVCVYVYVYVCV
jgi:hypothetical protein